MDGVKERLLRTRCRNEGIPPMAVELLWDELLKICLGSSSTSRPDVWIYITRRRSPRFSEIEYLKWPCPPHMRLSSLRSYLRSPAPPPPAICPSLGDPLSLSRGS